MPASTAAPSNDPATVIAVGVLASTLAATCHETVGHGLGCVGAGGHVTLLTSIWFRCQGAPDISYVGGPLGNLLAGSAALAALRYTQAGARVRLFWLLFGTINLFWFTGQLIYESLTNAEDDWYYFIAAQIGGTAIRRGVGATVGIGGYLFVTRAVTAIIRQRGGPQGSAIRLAYAAAVAAALIAGLLWRPEPFRSAFEEFLTLGVAPLGLLNIPRNVNHNVGMDGGASSVARSWLWIAASVVALGVFLLVQAPGLGPLATSRLTQ